MRHVTAEGIALIKRFESFSASIYTCPAGYPTIGYGHVVKERESREYASGIDEAKLWRFWREMLRQQKKRCCA